jgi:hypothetical protein
LGLPTQKQPLETTPTVDTREKLIKARLGLLALAEQL